MSEVKVNKISPRTNCGTVQLGDSGDTITIPAGATITNSGTANGFGADGAVNWQTSIKTATFTAANQEGYFCNTSGGAFTVNLPAGSAGNIIAIKDYAGTFQTNNLTITPNGSDKIDGVNGDATISTENAAIVLVFADSTRGWLNVNDSTNVEGASYITATGGTITTCGDWKIHTFTSPGTFCVTGGVGSLAVADYLVVAGGGGGGGSCNSGDAGAGGGAGGFRESSPAPGSDWTDSPLGNPGGALPVSIQGYPITVGAGGSAGGTPSGDGGTGSNSIFSTITSAGGGFGQGRTGGTGGNGGSGGGSAGNGPTAVGGTGNTPPVSPPQGQPGGSQHPVPVNYFGAGGGGATAAGENENTGGSIANGGAGAGTGIHPSTCVGTPGPSSPLRYFAGGGGGGAVPGRPGCFQYGTVPGGVGGGGNGGPPSTQSGTTNTGGGGAGATAPQNSGNGGAGGSGIVIIRYKFQ